MDNSPRSSGTRPLEELYRDEYVSLHGDPHGPLLRYTRSSVPFPLLVDVERSFESLIEAVDRWGRRGRVVFADARAAPGRNDPAFEAVMRRLWPRMYRGIERVGVLVQSTIGKMHVERLAQEDGVARKVSLDEQELLDYLLSTDPPPASRTPASRGRATPARGNKS